MDVEERASPWAKHVHIFPNKETIIEDVNVTKYLLARDITAPATTISWRALGDVSIERAEQFIAELQHAVTKAKEMESSTTP